MSYQVLARKWRPRNFKEMVGQEHVLRALINALDNDRLHHAFLFTGTRGVGKTTISRILAKSLNCDQGVSSSPCGVCGSCKEIDEGRFVDLIEVDAASRTKVEDTRELLENVQYAPTRGRYKVYLIDEVHMLSSHSFNALLKTLEEPPPHVKFLLATTDPKKLPITILSRCLQFSLRRLPVGLISNHLKYLLEQEQIPFQTEALPLLAHAADGSMRDGLSLLEQAIAYGGGEVQEGETRSMLGTIDRHYIFNLLNNLSQHDGAAVMHSVEELSAQAPDYHAVCAELISTLQRIALAQMVPSALTDEEQQSEALSSLATQMTPEAIQLYYQIALHMRRDLPLAPDPRGGLEMGLLRMLAFHPVGVSGATKSQTGNSNPAQPHTPSSNEKIDPAQEALASAKKPVKQTPPVVNNATTAEAISPPATKMPPSNSAHASAMAAVRHTLTNKEPEKKLDRGLDAKNSFHSNEEKIAEKPRPEMGAHSKENTRVIAGFAGVNEDSGAFDTAGTENISSEKASNKVSTDSRAVEEVTPRITPQPSTPPQTNADCENWAEVVALLKIGGMTRQLAMHCTLTTHDSSAIELCLARSHEQFVNQERKEQLQQALSDHFSNTLSLQIIVGDADTENPMQIQQRLLAKQQQAAEQSIQSDPFVQAMQQIFAAKIIPDSITPTG
ncbi:DNA polymerase III subunits gamma and tau [hydrothermal vent metagenome]|uniref:DNA-directed DNA polymerase n=1 Tax=hydrothermal vent metagenome TaxID=652676 RepID=A0A3B0Z634_9ZZZZ